MSLMQQLRELLGDRALFEAGVAGPPRVAPRDEEAAARLFATAHRERWRIRVEGTGHWIAPDAPADLVVVTGQLNRVSYFDPADLVTTVGAGLPWAALRDTLAEGGSWVAVDPPGLARSVGSVVVTGTAGTLRTGYGNVRDHVLGLTLVTGDGRIVRAGGRVVKNVAGFDLAKLATGSFGAFGLVTSVTFRLRAVPRADVTLLATGPRDGLLADAQEIVTRGITPAALELIAPAVLGGVDWGLAVRLLGSGAEVAATRDAARGAARAGFRELDRDGGIQLWRSIVAGFTRAPITIRLGALLSSLDRMLDLVEHHLPDGWLSAATAAGAIRWCGDTEIEKLRLLRHTAAQQETPVTLERAPWPYRSALGHFGAYREGVGRLLSSLRTTFDPGHVLVVPVGEQP